MILGEPNPVYNPGDSDCKLEAFPNGNCRGFLRNCNYSWESWGNSPVSRKFFFIRPPTVYLAYIVFTALDLA